MKFKICLYFWGVFGPWRGSVASYTTDERAKNGQKERWRLNLEEIKLQIKSSSERFRQLHCLQPIPIRLQLRLSSRSPVNSVVFPQRHDIVQVFCKPAHPYRNHALQSKDSLWAGSSLLHARQRRKHSPTPDNCPPQRPWGPRWSPLLCKKYILPSCDAWVVNLFILKKSDVTPIFQ